MGKERSNEGFTKIPNDILDALCRADLTGEALKCVFFILRKTAGWHKDEDWISNIQFVQATGLKKQNVNRSLNTLVKKGIVIKDDYKKRGVYGLQRDVSRWSLSSSAITKRGKLVIMNDAVCNHNRGNLVITTEPSIYTKENTKDIQKKRNEDKSSFEKMIGINPCSVLPTIDSINLE